MLRSIGNAVRGIRRVSPEEEHAMVTWLKLHTTMVCLQTVTRRSTHRARRRVTFVDVTGAVTTRPN